MASPAMAQQPRNGNGMVSVLQHLAVAAIVAVITFIATTNSMSAVQNQRLGTLEEQMKTKASLEATENFKREVLDRLRRIEDKVDKNRR